MRPLEFTLLFVNESLGMLSVQFAGQDWEAGASGKGAKTKIRAARTRTEDFNRISKSYTHTFRRGFCKGNKGADTPLSCLMIYARIHLMGNPYSRSQGLEIT